MKRGGRRIRIRMYQKTNGDVMLGSDLLDKELSNNDVNGNRYWLPLYRGKPRRPKQAVKIFLFDCIDRGVITWGEPAAWSAEYWARDMNLTKDKRLLSQK